ncbi:MAG: YceI family protein [Acidobacteriaceae bacterium]|nr:YceI family protein [Acidobacteriaceae bacterium]
MLRAQFILVSALSFLLPAVNAEQRVVDPRASSLTVHVARAGLLSALGHDHEIAAPIASGSVDAGAGQVELEVHAAELKVRDADISEKDREEIQRTMLGPEVLDAERYPTIVFRASTVESRGSRAWTLRGNLTLHGQTRPVLIEVRESGGHYVGSSRFKQTEFNITPVKAAGGTIRVKDEIQISFDIQLSR